MERIGIHLLTAEGHILSLVSVETAWNVDTFIAHNHQAVFAWPRWACRGPGRWPGQLSTRICPSAILLSYLGRRTILIQNNYEEEKETCHKLNCLIINITQVPHHSESYCYHRRKQPATLNIHFHLDSEESYPTFLKQVVAAPHAREVSQGITADSRGKMLQNVGRVEKWKHIKKREDRIDWLITSLLCESMNVKDSCMMKNHFPVVLCVHFLVFFTFYLSQSSRGTHKCPQVLQQLLMTAEHL